MCAVRNAVRREALCNDGKSPISAAIRGCPGPPARLACLIEAEARRCAGMFRMRLTGASSVVRGGQSCHSSPAKTIEANGDRKPAGLIRAVTQLAHLIAATSSMGNDLRRPNTRLTLMDHGVFPLLKGRPVIAQCRNIILTGRRDCRTLFLFRS